MNYRLLLVSLATALALSASLNAALIVDFSPDATGATISPGGDASVLANKSTEDNWAETLFFDLDTTLTGMDIYTLDTHVSLGDIARIKIWTSPFDLISFTSVINLIDDDGIATSPNSAHTRAHVDFGPNSQFISAGSFILIGMSGDTKDIGQYSLTGPNAPQNEEMIGAYGDALIGPPPPNFGIGDMAFRLYGDVAQVPDQGSMTTLLSFVILGGLTIARRKITAARP